MGTAVEAARNKKVLLVGWDGVRDDVLRRMQPRSVGALAASGYRWTMTLPGPEIAPTVTAVGWSTVLTGVWPDKHRVLSNEGENHQLHRYPDLLTRAFCSDPRIATFGAASALIFGTEYGPGPLLGPGVREVRWLDRRKFEHGFADTDPLIARDAAEHLLTADPDLSFVYFGETDDAAHHGGIGVDYEQAILRQDERLATLLEAIEHRPSFEREEWLVLLTTDHGHLDGGGHGGGTWQERQSFLVAGGYHLPAGRAWEEDARPVDIAPTIWEHLGVAIDPRWCYEGRSLLGR